MKYIVFFATVISFLSILKPAGARSNIQTVKYAINLNWCGRPKRSCEAGREAFRVAGCETGHTYNIWARNGQYLGLFQMGSMARNKFGHAWNAWAQAKAAHKYYLYAGGWGPWSCSYAA